MVPVPPGLVQIVLPVKERAVGKAFTVIVPIVPSADVQPSFDCVALSVTVPLAPAV